MIEHSPCIGVDLGGTKIESILLDIDGRELARRRCPTPRGSAHAIVEAIAAEVRALEAGRGAPLPVGIGTPGSLSPVSGLLRNSNTTELNGYALREALQQALARPLAMANDADCLALSEAHDGAAAGATVVFGVIVGTGTGGGLVAHGHLLAGANGIGGEWGHNPLPWPAPGEGRDDGPPCWCGKRGCIETFLSGPGFAADHARLTGVTADAAAVVAAARNGEALAQRSLTRYLDRFARALASVINIVDPDVVVIGGGMSNIDELHEALPRQLPRWVFSDSLATRIVRAQHGDSSGVRGAARLALSQR